jgi:nucleoside-diphosphate-sugar epimerase
MSKDARIFITGAGGFIGARIAEILYLTGWKNVKAGVRNWASCSRIGTLPVEIVKADLLNKNELARAVKGSTHIIHCAYGPPDVTIGGTLNLQECIDRSELKRFIHLSTIEVYTNPKGLVDENFPCSSTGNVYGDTKLEAEKICLKYIKKGYPITILRLPIVYGPFSRNWSVNFAKMLIKSELGLLDKYGEGKCNLLYVDDLVRAIVLSLFKDAAVGEIFNINGPDFITWNEYFKKFGINLNLSELKQFKLYRTQLNSLIFKPVRWIGGYLRDHHMNTLKLIGQNLPLADSLMRRTESKLKVTLSSAELQMFSRDAFYSYKKANRLIGYLPMFTVDRGLALTSDWIKQQGFLFERQNLV